MMPHCFPKWLCQLTYPPGMYKGSCCSIYSPTSGIVVFLKIGLSAFLVVCAIFIMVLIFMHSFSVLPLDAWRNGGLEEQCYLPKVKSKKIESKFSPLKLSLLSTHRYKYYFFFWPSVTESEVQLLGTRKLKLKSKIGWKGGFALFWRLAINRGEADLCPKAKAALTMSEQDLLKGSLKGV